MLPELLAPAGTPAAFKAALAGGADAIYCALGNEFNARRMSDNFDDQSFKKACHDAHLAGTKVYVTINIIIKQEEILSALRHIKRAQSLGADAFIIQDLGLFMAVRTLWPQLETHISTQANIHDVRGAAFMKELGAKRITLSRELSLPEIKDISKTDIDLEVFTHGALCFCYSGLCFLSSLSGNRSANRGLCAQPCRLEYDLVNKVGKVLSKPGRVKPLCPKDACTYDELEALKAAGAGALKIEGRMKAPEYVFNVIKAYRNKLDSFIGETLLDAENKNRLQRSFNRGFTHSYLQGQSNDDMMSYERSNNQGEVVGVALSGKALPSIKVKRGTSQGGRVRNRMLTQAEICIKLNKSVAKGDLLEVRPLDNPTQYQVGTVAEDAPANSTIKLITSAPCPAGSVVRLIRSNPLIQDFEQATAHEYVRHRVITAQVYAHIGEPIRLILTTCDGECSAEVTGFVVEAARTKAVSSQDVIDHVSRLGGSPFVLADATVDIDEGVGMGFSALHALRKDAVSALEELICSIDTSICDGALSESVIEKTCEYMQGTLAKRGGKQAQICVTVGTAKAAELALSMSAHRVYAPYDAMQEGNWDPRVQPVLDEICRPDTLDGVDGTMQGEATCMIANVSELAYLSQTGKDFEVSWILPVVNQVAASFFAGRGASCIWLSHELTSAELTRIAQSVCCETGVLLFGKRRAMTSEHCILKVADKCIHDCRRCGLRNMPTYLQAKNDGKRYPVYTNTHERSYLYESSFMDLTPYIKDLLNIGISRFMIDMTFGTTDEVKKALEHVQQAFAEVAQGKKPLALPQSVVGHYFEAIQ